MPCSTQYDGTARYKGILQGIPKEKCQHTLGFCVAEELAEILCMFLTHRIFRSKKTLPPITSKPRGPQHMWFLRSPGTGTFSDVALPGSPA